ncbi:hypothetical protein FVE85_1249 [Porphyridium purpureum]|uniref:Uncharacterized protein n=1 Tax=Porphyridium purpureum TaxID=35688 RepID=A0A5J4YIC6_PORPP|nr:hypothetical protein FVE85_1249 [Porphyridium purpureum]|eukprot:POR7402..scf251_18
MRNACAQIEACRKSVVCAFEVRHVHRAIQRYAWQNEGARTLYSAGADTATSSHQSHVTHDTSSESSAAQSGHRGYIPYVTYQDLDHLLRKRGYGGYTFFQLFVGLSVASAAGVTIFWGRIKLWGAKESADVARQTLEDEELKRKAEDLAKQVANTLLSDETTFVAMQRLIMSVLTDPVSAASAKEFTTDLLTRLLEDESVKTHAAKFVADVLYWDVVRKASADLAVWVLERDYVIAKGQEYAGHVLQGDWTRQQGKEYLTWAAVEALKSEETRLWASDVAMHVLADQAVRDLAAEAMWNATKNGVLYGMWLKNSKATGGTLEPGGNAADVKVVTDDSSVMTSQETQSRAGANLNSGPNAAARDTL